MSVSGGPSPQKPPWVIFAVLGAFIAGAVILWWKPATVPVTTAPPSPGSIEARAGLEGVLDWPSLLVGIVRMSQDPNLALSPEQAGRLLPLVKQLDQDLKPFFQFETAAFVILTPEQLAFIEDHPAVPPPVVERVRAVGGTRPLIDAVIRSVEERSRAALRFSSVAYITPSPQTVEERVTTSRIRSRELLWGILLLNQEARLALTRDEAAKLMPWLNPLQDAHASAQKRYDAILGVLSAPQRAFMTSTAATPMAELTLPAPPPGQDALFEEVKRICQQRAKSG